MKTIKSTIGFYIIVLLCLSPLPTLAATMVNGKATVDYETSLFSRTPDEKLKAQAFEKAKRQAWEKYTQSFTPAKLSIYRGIESKIVDQLNDFFLKVNIIDENTDEEHHRYSVTVRATINDARLQTLFSQTADQKREKAQGSGVFTYLFVAREQESVTHYDKTRIKSQVKRGDQSMTSGSTVKSADKVEYRLLSPDTINAAMNQALSSAGFEVVNYGDVVSECGGSEPKAIRETFTVDDNMSREQRKSAIDAAKSCEVTFFAVGTLDVVMADTDPVTGNQRVYVSVKSQVWNIQGKLPKQVASVGPVQYQGLGPNNLVAQNNALSLATDNVAKEIINQLNAKGLH